MENCKYLFKGEYVNAPQTVYKLKFRTVDDLLANSNYIFSRASMFTNPYIDGQSSLKVLNTLDFNSPFTVVQHKLYHEFCLLMSEIMTPTELMDLCGKEFTDSQIKNWAPCSTCIECTLELNGEEYDLFFDSLDMFEIIE